MRNYRFFLEKEILRRLETEGIPFHSHSIKRKPLELFFHHYRSLLFNFAPDVDPFFSIKNSLMGFGYFGRNTRIRSGLKCSHPENIYFLGEAFFNYSCTFLANAPILFGKNIAIGSHVGFYTINHSLDSSGAFVSEKYPIYVEDYVWIGGHAVILPGVKIARKCVIGAAAVLTQSTEEGYLYAGVPARKIKKLS